MPFESFPELPDWFWYPITFLYGSIVGSFLNVVIYRMPLGLSLTTPPSSCPKCGNKLRGTDNIPLLGFLMLKGRCGFCRAPISWRYFSIELLTACLWAALYHRLSGTSGISWVDFIAQALFASVLVAMIFIDLDHFIALDELNWVGIALGVARDIACLALAWVAGGYIWKEWAAHFLYFGWLPRFLVGALVYGGVLYMVSLVGFLVYARGENESLGSALRRFVTFEDLPEPSPEERAAQVAAASSVASPTTPPLQTGNGSNGSVAAMLPPEQPRNTSPVTADETPAEEEDGEAPRLRFSPGIIAILAAGLMAAVVGPWALLVLLVPLSAFIALARRPNETVGGAVGRFFRPAEDDNYAAAPLDDTGEPLVTLPDDIPFEEMSPSQRAAAMQAESDLFAKEAESGKHGAMGFGDVKLALAVGAVLGPGLALLSLLIATCVGAITGSIVARLAGRSLRYSIPFVPFMAVGAIISMLYGSAILDWYQSRFLVSPTEPPAAAPAVPARPYRGLRPGP